MAADTLLTLAEMRREEEAVAPCQTTENAEDALKLAIYTDKAKLYQQMHLHNIDFSRCNARAFMLVLDKHQIHPEGVQLSTFIERPLPKRENTKYPRSFSWTIRRCKLPRRRNAGDPKGGEEIQSLCYLLGTIEDQPRWSAACDIRCE
jgi:hypothetical protein